MCVSLVAGVVEVVYDYDTKVVKLVTRRCCPTVPQSKADVYLPNSCILHYDLLHHHACFRPAELADLALHMECHADVQVSAIELLHAAEATAAAQYRGRLRGRHVHHLP